MKDKDLFTCMVNTVAADVLLMQGAGSSAAMALA